MRDYLSETPVNSPVNLLRFAPAWLNGHLIPSVRTVMTDSANQTAQTLLSAGMRRVSVPQDAGERVDFVAKWVQRNQRRVAAGLPISVLVLALSAAEAQAQEELVSLAAQEGVESVVILANGDVQVTYTNGNVVVLAENSVVISATGEVLVTVAVAEGAALSAGVAVAGGAVGAAGLGAAGLLASLSDGSADPVTSGSDTGGTDTGGGNTGGGGTGPVTSGTDTGGGNTGGGNTGGTDTGGGNTGGGGTVTPDNGVGGRVIDGYIAGATVFRDLNANRILDAGEPNVTSNAEGNFTGLTGTGGVIVSVGGTDISTGQPFTGIMTAPAGATVVTPLTTLVQAMVEQNPALTVEAANEAVVRAFRIQYIRVEIPGEDGDSAQPLVPQNLLTFDPTAGRDGLDVFAAGAKVAAIMLVAAAAAGDTPAEQAAAVRAVAQSLAAQIAQNAATQTDTPLLTQAAILDALDDALGDDDANVGKAELIEAIIGAINTERKGSISQLFGAIEDVQTYVQGALVNAIKDGVVPGSQAVTEGIAASVSLRPTINPQRIFFGSLSEVILEEEPLYINGSGRPGSVVTVTFGGFTSRGITVDEEGGWTFTLTADDLEKVIEGTAVSSGPFGGAFEMQAVAKETIGTVTITSPVTVIGEFAVDLTAPDSPEITGQIAGDGIINGSEANGLIRVQGTVEAGVQQVEYWINDDYDSRQSMSVMSTSSGPIFEFFLTANGHSGFMAVPSTDGPFTLNIVSIDAGRNRSEPTPVTLNVDRLGPSAPTLNTVNDGDAINAEMAAEGVVVTGRVSRADLPTLDTGDIVRLTLDGVTFIEVVVDDLGNYTATLNADNLPEEDGTAILQAQRVDLAGNISETTQSITIDRTAPAAPSLNRLGDSVLNATEDLVITGTAELDSIIIVRINGQQVGSASTTDGAFSITVGAQSLRGLTDGQITVSVTAQDGAFNESPAATTSFTYDGTPPAAPVINPQSDLIFNSAETSNGVVFTGTAEPLAKVSFMLVSSESQTGFGVFERATADSTGAFTITFANDMVPDGTYTLVTSVEDAAGNLTRTDIPNVVVDRVAPTAPFINITSGNNIIDKADAAVNDPLMITGSAQASTTQVEVTFNGISNVFDVNQSGGYFAPFPLSNLPTADDTYDVTVVAIDAAGNRSAPRTQSILIDRTPPDAPVLTNPDQYTVLNAAELANGLTISGTALGTHIVSVTFGGLASGQFPNSDTGAFRITVPASTVPDGPAEITINARDAAGNVTSTVINTTIDRTPPAAAVITGQSTDGEGLLTLTGTLPNEPNAVLSIEVTNSDQGISTFTPTITGQTFTLNLPTPLPDGTYTFTTRITDAAGNQTVGQGYTVEIGAPPELTPAEMYATALTLDKMVAAVEALIEGEPTKFSGIEQANYPILAADLLMQRGGTYSITFTSEKISQSGDPTALVTNNPTGTDVSGTFHIPVNLISFANDLVAQKTNDNGVFEFSVDLQGQQANTFNGADALDLVTGVTNLRMEVLETSRASLPDDETLTQMLGPDAANKILAAFAAAAQTDSPVYFTYLTIWAPGNSTSDEGQPFTGNDLTLVFSQFGDVGLNAFFTKPSDTLSIVTNTQYVVGEYVGAEVLAPTRLSVEFTPTVTGDDLGQMLLDAAALRTAVTNVIEAADAGTLTVQLLDELYNAAGATDGEVANNLRLLAGEQLQAADVQRLFAFLMQPIADQTTLLTAFNGSNPSATTLTDVLDNTLLLPPSLLEGTQVSYDANNPEWLYINGIRVDVGGEVRRLAGLEGTPIVEMRPLDLTNPDLTWQITPGGNVVVAAFIDGPQAVPQDMILVYGTGGNLLGAVTNTGDQDNSFFVNQTLSDADGVVFSMINTSTAHSAGSMPFTTHRIALGEFDTMFPENVITRTPSALTLNRPPLLTFTVPNELDGLDFNPTSAIELTDSYGLSRMLIQVENEEGDGLQTLLYTSGSPSTLDALPAHVYQYSVVLNGPNPDGLLLHTNSLDTNGPEASGVITQNSVYYFDLALGRITSVQTMGADDVQDVLYGQGANDIIIPLGVAVGGTERIDLPFPGYAPVSGVETIVVDLNDVFAGNKIAVYGFDLAQDKIAFFESDLFGPAIGYNAIHVTVGRTDSFDLDDVLASAGLAFVDSLTFFAVDDGDNTILFATDGTRSGEVAWLNNVDLSSDQNLLVTPFPLEDLLVPLPT